jgi:predicted nucleic acid-binding protein
MKVVLLDTNTLSYILKNRQPVEDRFQKALEDGARFLLASAVHYELTRYLELKGASRLMDVYVQLVESWLPCNLSFEDWNDAALLWAERHRIGKSISDLDLLLATVARKPEAILVTSNTRHFENLGLVLEDWAQ